MAQTLSNLSLQTYKIKLGMIMKHLAYLLSTVQ